MVIIVIITRWDVFLRDHDALFPASRSFRFFGPNLPIMYGFTRIGCKKYLLTI